MESTRTHSFLVASRRGIARLSAIGAVLALALIAIPASASAAPPNANNPECDTGVPATDSNGSATRYTCTYPISVDGYAVKQRYLINVPHPGVTADATITHMDTDVVDEDRAQVPISQLMLHHIVFLNTNHADATCNGQGIRGFDGLQTVGNYAPERFFGAGEERLKMTMPEGYGYAGGADSLWPMVYMVMNHRKFTDHAWIQYSYVVSDQTDLKPVRPYWLDEANCSADPIFNIPGTGGPKSTDSRTFDYTAPVAGRIVAGAGHVHGGARKLTITEPDCNNRRVAESIPTWGYTDHPFYNVRPILHEPGPINMTAFGSETGIPVAAGDDIRLNTLYDNSAPHVRVMGIFQLYVYEGDDGLGADDVATSCDPVPPDVVNTNRPDGRDGPVPFTIPLTGLDSNGDAITIQGPPGKLAKIDSGATIDVQSRRFSRNNVILKKGGKLTWKFIDSGEDELHNVTLANGPVGIGSPNLDAGRTFTKTFDRPGTYQIFCALHPVQMTERVVVKAKMKSPKGKKHKNRHKTKKSKR